MKEMEELQFAFENFMRTKDANEISLLEDFFFRKTLDILYSKDRKRAGMTVEKLSGFSKEAYEAGDREKELLFANLATLITLAYEITYLEGLEEAESEALKESLFKREWEDYKKKKKKNSFSNQN